MKKLFSLALVVSTAALVNSVFAFAKYVDITTTYTGGDVTDFPVLVKITSTTPTGFYSDVKNAGADLKFTDASGAGDYPYEIDTWNASGDSYIWVKLPKLSAGMTFRMYYGDEEQTAQTTKPTDVWTGYDLVCHVNDASDSTINNVEGKLNPDATSKTDGAVGKTYGTDSTAGAALANRIYTSGSTGFLPNGTFSYSFWFRPNAAVAMFASLVGPRNASNADTWGIHTYNPVTMIYVSTAQNKSTIVNLSDAFEVGEWHKIDVTMNGEEVSFFLNGTQVGQTSKTGSAPMNCWVQWMGWGGLISDNAPKFSSANSLVADFDECRIFSTVADAARVAADYQTVANVATFLSFSDPHGEVVVEVLPQGVIFK